MCLVANLLGLASPLISLRLLPANDNRTVLFLWEEGAGQIQWKQLLILQVPSLDPQFDIVIMCNFQAVESFTSQVNQFIDA